jgi:hypothetical protein
MITDTEAEQRDFKANTLRVWPFTRNKQREQKS